ncbi:FecR domain-containing protein [Pseudopedobacter sp.]|uniref:FecR family protein n=1 Tax=Pseudopedobacter sp. TaxID=1936787 RepID=UPI003341C568
MINKSEILELLEKSLQGKLSQEEEKHLDYLLLKDGDVHEIPFEDEAEREEIEHRLLQKIHQSKNKNKIRVIKKYLVAATISTFALATGIHYYFSSKQPLEISKNSRVEKKSDINLDQPVLTLSDGTKVNLNQTNSGVLTTQENVEIIGNEGLLSYSKNSADHIVRSQTVYNTLKTPNGVQYHLALSDGTRVWLNGNSEIKFPVLFNGEERVVELSGEAYFEVAKTNKPFKVSTDNTVIQVLGTHFNVKAYKDDTNVKTTLLEGSVKVASLGKEKILRPGQEAVCSGSDILIHQVDVELAVGWRNGLFTFNNEPLEQVMKQISRWYNMEVIYSGVKPQILFTGIIPIRDNIQKALMPVGEAASLSFDIKVNKIIVTKNND